MKLLKYILPLLFVAIIASGCSSAKPVTKSQLADRWILKSINNKNANTVFTEKIPYLTFNFNIEQISGNSGCNTYSGRFVYDNGVFRAPNLVTTQMACFAANEEPTFLRLLGEESKLSIMNGDLIFSQNNQPVLIFYRAKPLSATDLYGIWRLKTIDGKDAKSEFKEKLPTLEFNFSNNRINGNAGCNTYNAPFTLAKNVFAVSPLVTTRMSCDVNDKEAMFVKMLAGDSEVELDGNTLTVRRENKVIMTFER